MFSRNLNRLIVSVLFLSSCALSFAQNGNTSLKDFYVETRFAYESEYLEGTRNNSNSAFKGQWLNLRLDGQITDNLSYSFRHRLNKNTSPTFFDATDWIHLDWKVNEKFTLSGGKQVVAIGGYEYDRAPIDLYYCSEFWNNIPCYQFGVSGAYNVSDNDQLLLQLCNSPFRGWADNDLYAVNLMWYGSHGFWETMWSFNMLQRHTDSWMNYIALGNRFNFTDAIHLDVDLMNRYGISNNESQKGNRFLFDDWSLMTELSVNASDDLRLFGKYTYDNNSSGTGMDVLVLDGTKLNMVSAGGEWNINPRLKAFCVGAYGWGENTNPDGTRLNEQFRLEAGVKFRLDILSGIRNMSK